MLPSNHGCRCYRVTATVATPLLLHKGVPAPVQQPSLRGADHRTALLFDKRLIVLTIRMAAREFNLTCLAMRFECVVDKHGCRCRYQAAQIAAPLSASSKLSVSGCCWRTKSGAHSVRPLATS